MTDWLGHLHKLSKTIIKWFSHMMIHTKMCKWVPLLMRSIKNSSMIIYGQISSYYIVSNHDDIHYHQRHLSNSTILTSQFALSRNFNDKLPLLCRTNSYVCLHAFGGILHLTNLKFWFDLNFYYRIVVNDRWRMCFHPKPQQCLYKW